MDDFRTALAALRKAPDPALHIHEIIARFEDVSLSPRETAIIVALAELDVSVEGARDAIPDVLAIPISYRSPTSPTHLP